VRFQNVAEKKLLKQMVGRESALHAAHAWQCCPAPAAASLLRETRRSMPTE
jgi:hypothetical protein